MITVAVGLKVGYRKVRIGNRKVTEVLLQQSSWEAMAAWGSRSTGGSKNWSDTDIFEGRVSKIS